MQLTKRNNDDAYLRHIGNEIFVRTRNEGKPIRFERYTGEKNWRNWREEVYMENFEVSWLSVKRTDLHGLCDKAAKADPRS